MCAREHLLRIMPGLFDVNMNVKWKICGEFGLDMFQLNVNA